MSYFSHILVHQNQGSRLKWFINHTPRFVTFEKTRIAINQNIVIFMGSINLKQYSLAKEMVKRYDLRYSTGCQEKNSPLTQYSMVDCPFFLPNPVLLCIALFSCTSLLWNSRQKRNKKQLGSSLIKHAIQITELMTFSQN